MLCVLRSVPCFGSTKTLHWNTRIPQQARMLLYCPGRRFFLLGIKRGGPKKWEKDRSRHAYREVPAVSLARAACVAGRAAFLRRWRPSFGGRRRVRARRMWWPPSPTPAPPPPRSRRRRARQSACRRSRSRSHAAARLGSAAEAAALHRLVLTRPQVRGGRRRQRQRQRRRQAGGPLRKGARQTRVASRRARPCACLSGAAAARPRRLPPPPAARRA